MGSSKLRRRKFIRLPALMSAAASVNPSSLPAAPANPISRWKGFSLLDILKQNKIGFALWEFNGDFGLLNSGRPDVTYEDWHGQKLDRRLLTLQQSK